MTATLRAENTTDTLIRAGRGCSTDYGLYKDGTWVGGHDSAVCPMGFAETDGLQPHEVRYWTFTFDALGPSDSTGTRRQLAPGRYLATAGMVGREAPTVWLAPAVEVDLS